MVIDIDKQAILFDGICGSVQSEEPLLQSQNISQDICNLQTIKIICDYSL